MKSLQALLSASINSFKRNFDFFKTSLSDVLLCFQRMQNDRCTFNSSRRENKGFSPFVSNNTFLNGTSFTEFFVSKTNKITVILSCLTTSMSTLSQLFVFLQKFPIPSPFLMLQLKLEVKALNRQILFKPKSYSSASKRNPEKYLYGRKGAFLAFSTSSSSRSKCIMILGLKKRVQLQTRAHFAVYPSGLPL